MKHRRHWRRAVCALLVGLLTSCAWGQRKAVGPVRVTLSPAGSTTVPNGTSVKLNLLKSFFSNYPPTSGTRNISGTAVWTSSDSTVFTVSSHGLATAVAATGTATITATVNAPGWGAPLNIVLTAAPAVLKSISLDHFNSSVAVSSNITYIATGHYSDGTTPNLTGSVTWGVTNHINSTGGTATNIGATVTGATAGIVEVTATSGIITGATFLNVGLNVITISTTGPAILPQGATQTFVALGDFSGVIGSVDVTNYVHWTSSDPTIARMSNGIAGCLICVGGFATAIASSGTANINASAGGVTSNTVALTVGPVAVTSITISTSGCNPANVPLGNSCEFAAVANYSNKTTATITGTANWITTDPTCVAVSSSGLATTLNPPPSPPNNPCSTNVTATITRPSPYNDTVTSNIIAMTVTAHALKSITTSPVNPSKPLGTANVQFTAKGHYTDGATITIPNPTAGLSWNSSNASVATIGSTSGLATIVAPGASTIGATYVSSSTFTASTTLNVTAAQLNTITVTAVNPVATSPPSANATVPVSGSQQFMATGNYTDGTHVDITTSVTWSSSVGANISNTEPIQGLATGTLAGVPTITATCTVGGGCPGATSTVTGTLPLTVQAISSMTVSPSAATININQTQTFTAMANYGGGVTQLLTAFAPVWSSNPTGIATIDQGGVATAVAGGSAAIRATLGSVSCTGAGGTCGSLTVNQPTLVSITVACDPDNPCSNSGESVLSLGQNEQMVATGNYSDGSTQDLTQIATWDSSNKPVATISTTGFVTTVNFGSTDITAKCTNGGACPGATSTVTGTLPLTVSF